MTAVITPQCIISIISALFLYITLLRDWEESLLHFHKWRKGLQAASHCARRRHAQGGRDGVAPAVWAETTECTEHPCSAEALEIFLIPPRHSPHCSPCSQASSCSDRCKGLGNLRSPSVLPEGYLSRQGLQRCDAWLNFSDSQSHLRHCSPFLVSHFSAYIT